MPSARHPATPPGDGLTADSDIVKLGLDNPDTGKIATRNAPNTGARHRRRPRRRRRQMNPNSHRPQGGIQQWKPQPGTASTPPGAEFPLEAAQYRDGRRYRKVCLTEQGRHHCLESGYDDNPAAARRSADPPAAVKTRQYAEAAAGDRFPAGTTPAGLNPAPPDPGARQSTPATAARQGA